MMRVRFAGTAFGMMAGVGAFNMVSWAAAVNPWYGLLVLIAVAGVAFVLAKELA